MAVVLVVDDEKSVADTLAMVLNRFGFEASAVYSGKQALDLLKVVTPAVVVSDVFMPGMNGIELASEIRKIHPDSKIILMSGNIGTVQLVEALPSEKREVLAKPFPPSELIEMLRTCLGDEKQKPDEP